VQLYSSIFEAGPAWFSITAKAYNALLQRHANRSPDSKFAGTTRFVDSCAAANAAYWKGGADPSTLTVDGTHPNDAGYALIGGGVVRALRAVGGPGQEAARGTVSVAAIAAVAVVGLILLGGRRG
jgi:lysophospholipase L1-like esterase